MSQLWITISYRVAWKYVMKFIPVVIFSLNINDEGNIAAHPGA